ncbi:unnamed protein product [Malus baccata var. baccata]
MVEWPSVELGSAGLSRKSSVICSDLRYFSLILTKSKIRNRNMSALFNFNSFLTVVLLVICTCTFVKMQFPAVLEQKTGFRGFFWKAARIGERLSPWVAFGCFTMGISIIFF